MFGGDGPAVGASGAIFGLFGVLLAASRIHHPFDRASRGLIGQLGFLVLLNLVLGFASGGNIDNAAHLGGFFAGLWLGAVLPPTRVPTLSSLWQRPGQPTVSGGRARTPRYAPLLAYGVVAAVLVTGLIVGTDSRERVVADRVSATTAVAAVVTASLEAGGVASTAVDPPPSP